MRIAAALLTILVAGCASLPSQEGRVASTAVTDTTATRLGRAVAEDVRAHPGQTGIHPLPNPYDAFAARYLVAAAAEASLDVQYYIFRGDDAGLLLLDALWQAAERGVRVRLLLDDLNAGALDDTIARLDAHPRIEVRLYNPLLPRGARAVAFLADFTRVNRRMHNKSFTADNQLSIVGGRNVGNEYFAAGAGVVFIDLDVLAVGAAVADVSREFDLYWNSASAYPAAALLDPNAGPTLESVFAAARTSPDAVAYLDAARTAPLVRNLLDRKLALDWTRARVVSDDPAKTLDTTARTDVLLFPELVAAIGTPTTALDLVSPYFVPGDGGTAALAALARKGVRVRILTNSLAATDAAVVHAGYARRRQALLEAGVRLYELKPVVTSRLRAKEAVFGSSTGSALHAKTFAVDRRSIFVGSFNFDQRSVRLNTEMGVVIDSPALAGRLADAFDVDVPAIAYEVTLRPDGGLAWIERTPGGEVRHDIEPATTAAMRSRVQFLSLLPIEWLL